MDPHANKSAASRFTSMPGRLSVQLWLAAGADVAVSLSGTGLVVATLAPFLHPLWPVLSMAEHFAVQILIGAILVAPLAVLRRRRRWLVVAVAVSVIQLATIRPYWPDFGSALAAPPAGVKIVTLNVWARNTNYDLVLQYLRDSGADVVGLVEATPQWRSEILQLNDLYPYRIACADQGDFCRQVLLSRRPFGRGGVEPLPDSNSFVIWGELQVPGAAAENSVTVVLTHLTRPFVADRDYGGKWEDGLPALTQTREFESLARRLGEFGPDIILIGDLNAAPWSRAQQALRRATGLDNRGFLALSWPSWAPCFLRLPIDHILTRGAPRIGSLVAGPDVGSDHRPVEAIVGFPPSANTTP